MEFLDAITEPMGEMDRRLFVIGSVIPGAIVFLTLVGVGLVRRKKHEAWPRWMAPLLILVAFVFAYASVHALNSVTLWPADGAKRILHSVVVIALAGAGAELLPKKFSGARAPILLLGAIGAIAIPLTPLIDIEDMQTFMVFVGVSFGACAVLAYTLAGAQARCKGWRVPLLAAAAPFSASLVAYYGSVASLGQIAGGMTAVLSAIALAGLFAKRAPLRASAWMTVFVPIVIVLAGARAYAYTPGPIWASVLALASPLPALACLTKRANGRWAWLVVAIQALLVGAMALGAIWIAYQGRSTYEY